MLLSVEAAAHDKLIEFEVLKVKPYGFRGARERDVLVQMQNMCSGIGSSSKSNAGIYPVQISQDVVFNLLDTLRIVCQQPPNQNRMTPEGYGIMPGSEQELR